MKENWLVGTIFLAVIVFAFTNSQITGMITQASGGASGPTASEVACMQACVAVGCEEGNMTCMEANSQECMEECGVEPEPEPASEGEACMQECVKRGCGEYDANCQNTNYASCEEECGNDSGTGPGIGQEGYSPPAEAMSNAVNNVAKGVNDFFQGVSNFFGSLFGGQ